MVDFEMTNGGDLKISASEKFPGFNISWYESEFPVLCLSWEQQETPTESSDSEGLTLTFNTNNENTDSSITVSPIRHMNELAQRLTILLRTELGSSPLSPELGTTLGLDRHKDIRDYQVLQSIQGKILAAIDGLVENPSVIIKVEEKDGPFYCQNVNVYVYQNSDLVYQTSIGG